jgi:hypothetical protein
MKMTIGQILLPFVVLAIGVSLVLAGTWGGWGIVWTAGGIFFITVGIGTTLLTLAWNLPGPLGAFLKRPLVSILILCAIGMTMCSTIGLGIYNIIK